MVGSFIALLLIAQNALADITASSSPDVGLYQICIWLPIVLVLIVLSTVYAMAYMDNGRDSLLYAKFLIAESDRERR